MDLESLMQSIAFDRVEFIAEDDTTYWLRYRNEEFVAIKDNQAQFSSTYVAGQAQGLSVSLSGITDVPNNIFIDPQAPKWFREVIAFHELREQEYLRHGFENAHQRAIHDELLYVIKFMPEKMPEYLVESQARRNPPKPVPKTMGVHEAYQIWRRTVQWGTGQQQAYTLASELLGDRETSIEDLTQARHLLADEREGFYTDGAGHRAEAFLFAVINKISEEEGTVSLRLPTEWEYDLKVVARKGLRRGDGPITDKEAETLRERLSEIAHRRNVRVFYTQNKYIEF